MLPGPSDAELERARERMIEKHLRARGIGDARVLDAFRRVRREEFVWKVDRDQAYADHPIRIGEGQTISQPYMVALMTQWLDLAGEVRVLEIGTGSGYQTAILAELAREVCTVERFTPLSESAQERLGRLGYTNVRFRVGDGTLGWPAEADVRDADAKGSDVQEETSFDRIIVTAGAPEVPAALKGQLAPGGRLVIPVGPAREQDLLVISKLADGSVKESSVCPCIFVKLVGEQGWAEG